MTSTCTAIVTWLGPCPFPAVAVVEAACVHEHVRRGPVCQDHFDDEDGADCLPCADGPEPHNCALRRTKTSNGGAA